MNYSIKIKDSKFDYLKDYFKKLYKEGHTIREIAKELDVSKSTIGEWRKKLGLTKRDKRKQIVIKCKTCNKEFRTGNTNAIFCSDGCRNKYNKDKLGPERLCVWCKEIFYHYEPREYCNIKCRVEHTKFKSTHNKLIERLIKAIDPNRQKKCEGCGNIFYASYTNKRYCNEKCRYVFKIYNHKCRECGKHYTDNIKNSAGCSDRCKRKYRNRMDEVNRRNKLRENGRIDWDISVDRLVNRDKGICYICNSKVNKNDYEIDNNGHFIAGNTYPSIDHVTPVVKGGTHTWDNVKLAHRICNTLKSDELLEM